MEFGMLLRLGGLMNLIHIYLIQLVFKGENQNKVILSAAAMTFWSV